MYPILFTIGSWQIPANITFFGLGCLAGFLMSSKEAARIGPAVGYSKRNLFVFYLGVIPFAYLVGRINGWIFNLDLLFQELSISDFISSGFISFGAVLGALLYGFLYSKICKLSISEELDLVALTLPLIESIYRIGCLLTGCCYGRETSGFGGIYLPDVNGQWAYRYPTQILLMVFNFCLFLWLWQRRTKKPYSGSQTFQYLIIYSIGRFLIDSLREGLPTFGIYNYQQIASIIIFTVSLIVFIKLRIFSHSSN